MGFSPEDYLKAVHTWRPFYSSVAFSYTLPRLYGGEVMISFAKPSGRGLRVLRQSPDARTTLALDLKDDSILGMPPAKRLVTLPLSLDFEPLGIGISSG